MKKNFKVIIAGILAGSTALLTACGGMGGGNSSNGNKVAHIDNPWWTTTGTLNKVDNEVVFSNVNLNLVTVVAGADLPPLKDIVEKYHGEITVKRSETLHGAKFVVTLPKGES